ncbi:MAG: hypothetical protein KF693_16845 [Nitrospira sp.]|nr:hypothetical protein [Nitrospira sp.]
MKRYRARYTKEAADRIRKFHPQVTAEIKQGIKDLLVAPPWDTSLCFQS